MSQDEFEVLAEELFTLIKPYYKSRRIVHGRPEFKKSLTSAEIQELLIGVHNTVVKIKTSRQRLSA